MAEPLNPTALSLPMPRALPGWSVTAPAETLEAAAFRSGTALAHLALVATAEDLPLGLWRDRLALAAAETCLGLAGRRETRGALRDAVHLTRPGDDPGPAGRILGQWSRAVARPVSVAGMARALDGWTPERIAGVMDAVGATPVDRAARVVEAVLAEAPRAETAALILADAVLSKSLGWTHVVPLLALRLGARDLRLTGEGLRLACHRAAAAGAGQAVPLVGDLARAAIRLRAVAPRLRAKGAARAVDLFLSRDAVAPSELVTDMRGGMSDRAARRLCERLVALGALRELTGRDTFRLYGV